MSKDQPSAGEQEVFVEDEKIDVVPCSRGRRSTTAWPRGRTFSSFCFFCFCDASITVTRQKKKKNNKIGAGKVSQIVSDQQIRVVSSNRGCRGSMSAPAQASISSPRLTSQRVKPI